MELKDCHHLFKASGIAALLASCAIGDPAWTPVLVGPEQVAQADSIESGLRAQGDKPAPPGKPWFKVIRGTAPFIVTAPHATRHARGSEIRPADRGTGSLAVMLHDLAGATVLYTTWSAPCDANDADSCAFKDTLGALLREIRPVMVLDLHASSAERPYDVDFGTMRGASVKADPQALKDLASALYRAGLTNQSRDFFKAEQQQTVTKFVMARSLPCMQLELNSIWLRPEGGSLEKHHFAQTLNALAVFLGSYHAPAKASRP